jgi:hypothetical protein
MDKHVLKYLNTICPYAYMTNDIYGNVIIVGYEFNMPWSHFRIYIKNTIVDFFSISHSDANILIDKWIVSLPTIKSPTIKNTTRRSAMVSTFEEQIS